MAQTSSSSQHDVTINLYYALWFMLVEHSVCHEPIFVIINIYIYIIYVYIYMYFWGKSIDVISVNQ